MEDRGYSKSQFVKSRPLQNNTMRYQKINEKVRQSAPLYQVASCMQNWRAGRKDMRGAEIKKGGQYHLTFKDQIQIIQGDNETEGSLVVLNLPSDEEEDVDKDYRYARVTQRYNERRESIIYSEFEKRGLGTDNQADNASAGINSSVPNQSPVNMPDQQQQDEPDMIEKIDGASELDTEDQNKKKTVRQPIAEVIIVESYKEYNALEELNTTSQNCCLLF